MAAAARQTPPPPAATAPQAARAAAARASAGGHVTPGYAGTDTCVLCHDAESKSITHSKHGQAKDPRSPAATLGCESCHGPGQAHVDDDAKGNIKRFKALKPAEVNETCLTCHNRGAHAGWESSTHAARQAQLHDLPQRAHAAIDAEPAGQADRDAGVRHLPSRAGRQDRAGGRAHARSRRQDVVLVVPQPARVDQQREGLKVGSSVNETCTTCHAEMRGPMLWEHTPVRENCTTCHDPHGSSNDRMLNVRMPMLCQRCHVATRHPASVYDNAAITTNKSNRMFGRSCVNCHSNVHGSNHPSGQFFMR